MARVKNRRLTPRRLSWGDNLDLPISSRRKAEYSSERESAFSVMSIDNNHRLTSMIRGESEVEELTFRITDRDAKRVVVTRKVQENFLLQCRNVAMHKRYKISTIRMKDLKDLRDKAIEELESEKSSIMAPIRSILSSMGFRDEKEQLASLLSRAYDVVSIRQHNEKGWFYYQDFHIYYLKVESRWPWMRSSSATSILIIISFYILTPIFFCYVVQDSGVCPKDPEGYRSYYGWLSSMYFASITLSTVGYGDVTVSKESDWNVFAGIVYMILCNVILILTFSTAADSTTNIFTRLNAAILHWVWGDNLSEHLHKKVRRATYLRVGQIICTFFFLNAIGIFASQICIRLSDIQDEEARWNWMTSFYWAVQTTTTIGYGDLKMDFNLRWFQVVYLIVSTYFVGNTLSGLRSLKDEIKEIKKFTAWNRRELSKCLIDENKPYEHNYKVDQFEFALASLVTLGKVTYSDVVPIMDKFRSLASENGFIEVDDSSKLNNDSDFFPSGEMMGPEPILRSMEVIVGDSERQSDSDEEDNYPGECTQEGVILSTKSGDTLTLRISKE